MIPVQRSHRRSPQRERELALFTYRNALDRGDFTTVAEVLLKAELDPALDRMLAEIQAGIENEINLPKETKGTTKMTPSIKLAFPVPSRVPRVLSGVSVRYFTAAIVILALAAFSLILYRLYPNSAQVALSTSQSSTSTPLAPSARKLITAQNVNQLKLLQEIPDARLSQLAFSADGTRIAYETKQNLLQVWNIAETRVEYSMQGGNEDTSGRPFALSADGHYLATIGGFEGLVIWDLRTNKTFTQGTPFFRSGTAGKGYKGLLKFSEDSATVYFLYCGHPASLEENLCDRFDLFGWNAATGEQTTELSFAAGVSGSNMDLMPLVNTWASGYQDGRLILHTIDSGKVAQIVTYSGGAAITNLAATRNGQFLAAVNAESQLKVWDTQKATEIGKPIALGTDHEIRFLVFSNDGTLLASRGAPGDLTIQFWDPIQGVGLSGLKVAEAGLIYDLIISPDGTLFATNGSDGFVRIWGIP